MLTACPLDEASKGLVVFDVAEKRIYRLSAKTIRTSELERAFGGGSIDVTGVVKTVGKDGIPVVEVKEFRITPSPSPGPSKAACDARAQAPPLEIHETAVIQGSSLLLNLTLHTESYMWVYRSRRLHAHRSNCFIHARRAVLSACGQGSVLVSDELETPEAVKQAEAWSQQDNPSIFTATLEYRYDKLPKAGEAAVTPWAGSYWPTYEDNINYKWAGAASDSPSKKYEKAFGGTNVEDAVSRYRRIESAARRCTDASTCNSAYGEVCAKRGRSRTEGRCVATWWGICHAWTPAAILLPEPRYPVTRNGVTFQPQDLKALASLVHDSTQTKFVSLRCNKMNSMPDGGGIRYDSYGRPIDADRECRDTNAGSYHLLLANYLG